MIKGTDGFNVRETISQYVCRVLSMIFCRVIEKLLTEFNHFGS